jgi:hypothetical protein
MLGMPLDVVAMSKTGRDRNYSGVRLFSFAPHLSGIWQLRRGPISTYTDRYL